MKVMYKAAIKEKEFMFQEGDELKIILTSFLYATESRPERVYEGKLVETEEHGFWATLTSATVFPYSEKERQTGITEQVDSAKDEFFAYADVEDVIGIEEDYPNRQDPLIRFALDGPAGAPRSSGRQPGRPSLGETRKVSLTLPPATWKYLDSAAEGNRSEFLRKLIDREYADRTELE